MAEFGTLSSLGIGSNGVLNYDVIDKLKNADKDMMIKPLEDKISLLQKRDKALLQFQTIGATVKGDIMDIADGTLFSKINTTVSGSSVSVQANDGVTPQTFDINVQQLAKNDIYESNGFSSTDDIIATKDASINIGVGGNTTSINISSGTSLQGLVDSINNANIGVTASIIDTGIGDNPYKLILKANDTGADNTISFDYSQLTDLGLNATNYTSASYSSDTDSVNSSGSTQKFSIDVNGTTYSMDVADGTTVKDFIDDLNNGNLKDSNGNSLSMNASYTDGKIEFNLKAVGNITINDENLTTDFNDNTDFTNTNRIQTAQDAKFSYNGVDVQRSKNSVDDLIPGVTINLDSTGDSSVTISNDEDKIVDSIKKFVADYNSMISNLQSLTAYDKDQGSVGLFQGNSDFTMLENNFSNDLFGTTFSYETNTVDRNGNSYTQNSFFSAADAGFDMNRNGMISFDENKFKENYEKNPDVAKRWFETTFTTLKDDFERTITGDNSNLNLLDQNIKTDEKDYQNRIDALNKYLDTKYNTMAQQFAAYDNTINQFNSMSQSLNMAIQSEINSKS